MKKIGLMVIALFLVSSASFAGDYKKIGRDFFGVHLGETQESLLKACTEAKITVEKNKWSFSDKDMPSVMWSFPGALNRNEAIIETKISSFNGYIYEIEVVFNDSSMSNYNVLKGSLEKKYGEDKAGFMGALETKSTHNAIFDGEAVTIILNRDIGFTEGDTLSLSYRYHKILAEVMKEYENRKAKKVEGDL